MVAEIGTVNGAAGCLGRTQAAVNMQIRKLEGLVGFTLFERSTKGLELTAEGQVLIPYAREIITLNDERLMMYFGVMAGERAPPRR